MTTKSQYVKHRLIGTGVTADVYLVKDKKNDTYAMKCFHSKYTQFCENEMTCHQVLKHPLIVEQYYVGRDYIIYDWVSGKDLFSYIEQSGFKKPVVQYYFDQLLEVVSYVHSQNYVHRDIKPENIVFDKDYNIKLIDFGFASKVEGMFTGKTGTIQFIAPELHIKGSYYDGFAVDVFALGIVLFEMVTGIQPFEMAIDTDQYFRCLIDKQFNKFWNAHAHFTPQIEIEDDFKVLIQQMLDPNPNQRIGLQEIKKHPWLKTERSTHSEVILYMKAFNNK